MQTAIIKLGDILNTEAKKLEVSIVTLRQLKEGAELYYPNIADYAARQIESNIRAVGANAKKVEQESNDEVIMKEFHQLDFDTGSIDTLSEKLETARELRSRLLLGENIRKVDEAGDAAKDRLSKLKAEKLAALDETELMYPSPKTLALFETIPPPNKISNASITTAYMISTDDLKVLARITVEAESEQEAKKIFVSHFTAHLDMINLKEK